MRLASLLLGSTAVAEDVVQDAFAKLYGRLNRVETPAAWLRTCVVNVCKNERRRWAVARRHAHLLAVDAVEPDAPVHELVGSLRSLPIRQRTVVVLRFYEDLPEADIAALLGIRIGTVKSRLHRATGPPARRGGTMNELAEILHEQAASSRPRADLDATLRRAQVRRQRSIGIRIVGAVGVVVLLVVGIATLQGQGGDPTQVGGHAPRRLPALVIRGETPVHGLDRRDSTATLGPWTVVVRRPRGSLGLHGAVVTFPAPAPTSGKPVSVHGATGRLGGGELVWPVHGKFARVRGDLADADLLAIARRTSIEAGRPSVHPPAGLVSVFTGPYRAPIVHEARYGSAPLGEGRALGNGLAYTGALSAGGFEDQLFAGHGQTGYRVNGHPAVLSAVQGGNGTLAWELSPGVVVYVGYSGNSLSDAAGRALTRLAERTRLISAGDWNAHHPQASEQTNGFQ